MMRKRYDFSNGVRGKYAGQFIHKKDCPMFISLICPVAVECVHGFDVCPICDRCTCDDQEPGFRRIKIDRETVSEPNDNLPKPD